MISVSNVSFWDQVGRTVTCRHCGTEIPVFSHEGKWWHRRRCPLQGYVPQPLSKVTDQWQRAFATMARRQRRRQFRRALAGIFAAVLFAALASYAAWSFWHLLYQAAQR